MFVSKTTQSATSAGLLAAEISDRLDDVAISVDPGSGSERLAAFREARQACGQIGLRGATENDHVADVRHFKRRAGRQCQRVADRSRNDDLTLR